MAKVVGHTFKGKKVVVRFPKTEEERALRVAYIKHLHDSEGLTDGAIAERLGINVTRVWDLRNDYVLPAKREALAQAVAGQRKGPKRASGKRVTTVRKSAASRA